MNVAQRLVQNAFRGLDNPEQATQDNLSILSGELALQDTADFLQTATQQGFEWAMVERVSAFDLIPASNFTADVPTLERVRLFGADGDLSVRRDSGRFYWLYVGSAEWQLPTAHDYWEHHDTPLLAVNKSYYQWRAEGDDSNSRVGTAWRRHWDADHLRLNQIHYLDNGRTAFVRYTGFAGGSK